MTSIVSRDCSICCKTLKNEKSVVKCPAGDVKCVDENLSCVDCLKKYLTDTIPSGVDPKCMFCSRALKVEDLYKSLPKAWVSGVYTKIRRENLFARECALMPETQEHIVKMKPVNDMDKPIADKRREIRDIMVKVNKLKDEEHRLMITRSDMLHVINGGETEKKVNVAFKCSQGECRGFVERTNYTCGLCEAKYCKSCHVPTRRGGDGGAGAADGAAEGSAAHECNPDNVASAKEIMNNTKPCPKCATRIHKASGCPQIFCTSCTAVFDWDTLVIQTTGAVHNPHYFAYVAERGLGGDGQVLDGDGPVCRGGADNSFPNYIGLHYNQYDYSKRKHYEKNKEIIDRCEKCYRLIRNILENTTDPAFQAPGVGENRDLRESFLKGEITEATFRVRIEQRSRKQEWKIAIGEVVEFIAGCASMTYKKVFGDLIHPNESSLKQCDEFLSEMDNLRNFANHRLFEISSNHNTKILYRINQTYMRIGLMKTNKSNGQGMNLF